MAEKFKVPEFMKFNKFDIHSYSKFFIGTFIFLTHVLMFELFMYVYSCNVLSARFFAVDRALNSYFMIMIMIKTVKCYRHCYRFLPILPVSL